MEDNNQPIFGEGTITQANFIQTLPAKAPGGKAWDLYQAYFTDGFYGFYYIESGKPNFIERGQTKKYKKTYQASTGQWKINWIGEEQKKSSGGGGYAKSSGGVTPEASALNQAVTLFNGFPEQIKLNLLDTEKPVSKAMEIVSGIAKHFLKFLKPVEATPQQQQIPTAQTPQTAQYTQQPQQRRFNQPVVVNGGMPPIAQAPPTHPGIMNTQQTTGQPQVDLIDDLPF